MSPTADSEAKEIFLAALERPAAERGGFVVDACRGDAELEACVQRLLDAHRGAELVLGAGVLAGTPPAAREPSDEDAEPAGAPPEPLAIRVGDRIGECVVTEVLGEGGFGVVLLAEQERPVRRRVAIKVLKAGLDSERVVRRFETEVQALAIMDHPSIARVFDAGTMPSGRRYFVMEYVEGVPITDYCERHDLGLRERLELVRQVCLALQHAHQKGVVHRDVKPSNVLVAEVDGRPVPKVIDFGVAKATGSLRMPKHLALTADGFLVGTPTYMSPEQISGDEDVDTRTDVYAVGVLLYELLCGVPPFETDALRFLELQRLVRDVDPPPPSRRGRRLRRAGDVPSTATRVVVPPELDWVVMRCLEKDRARRYATASQLAEEIERFLADEPVSAAPPSAWYRVRKLVRRHRAASVAAAVGLLAVAAGLVAVSWGMVLARESAAEARRERENVLRLSAFQVLEDLLAEAERLWPPHPERIAAMERWMARAEELVAGLDAGPPGLDGEPRGLGHRAQLAALRARALPSSDSEREAARRAHPRYVELERERARLAWLRSADDVRAGRALPERVVLDTRLLPEPTRVGARALAAQAWLRVDPDRASFGREAEGLELARLALERAEEGDLALLTDTLAWALLANGLDGEALAAAEETVAIAAPDVVASARSSLAELEEAVEHARSPERAAEIAALAERVAELDRVVGQPHSFAFADDEDRWWHAQLTRLVAEVEAFADPRTGAMLGLDPELGWGVARRLAFAREVEARSVTGDVARERWSATRAALADPRACPAYGGLALEPQLGLLPLGTDPESGLHEFAHLASGEPARRREDGSLELHPETGLVLVLLPGGRFPMGAQAQDPGGPNHDPLAQADESPVHEVELAPFFLSKFELTQGQWARLAGSAPSHHSGPPVGGVRQGPMNPVESLTAAEAERVLARFDLAPPTEAQWEYGARGGTDTPWWTGADARSLEGAANLLDSFAAAAGIPWRPIEEWLDDGHGVHAPIGSFRPNAFGLHEVAGNVSELCRDGLVEYWVPPAPGDGARGVEAEDRVARGGSFHLTADYARSALRSSIRPGGTSSGMGVRPSRAVRSGS